MSNRKKHHHLSESIRCARCDSALIYNTITGRGGHYHHFTCGGRLNRTNNCDMPYLPAHLVEEAIENLWHRETIHPDTVTAIIQKIDESLDQVEESNRHDAERLDDHIATLEKQRLKWAESVMDGTVPETSPPEK